MCFNSSIEWTTHTFNPWWGCTKVSDGCRNCYAEALSNRYGHSVWGAGKPRRLMSDAHWQAPLGWDADAKRTGRRARVFCASMADVFEEQAPPGQLARLWDLIRLTPNLDWQLLTKRPHRIAESLPPDWGRPAGDQSRSRIICRSCCRPVSIGRASSWADSPPSVKGD